MRLMPRWPSLLFCGAYGSHRTRWGRLEATGTFRVNIGYFIEWQHRRRQQEHKTGTIYIAAKSQNRNDKQRIRYFSTRAAKISTLNYILGILWFINCRGMVDKSLTPERLVAILNEDSSYCIPVYKNYIIFCTVTSLYFIQYCLYCCYLFFCQQKPLVSVRYRQSVNLPLQLKTLHSSTAYARISKSYHKILLAPSTMTLNLNKCSHV